MQALRLACFAELAALAAGDDRGTKRPHVLFIIADE
jgi:hypothetical protein